MAQCLLDPQAGVLLVGDGRHDDIAGQPEAGRLAGRDQRGGDAGLHVVGAAAEEAVPVDPGRVRIGHAFDADGVEVPAEQERAPTPFSSRANEHARSARRRLQALGVKSGSLGPPFDEAGNLRLAGPTAYERGVHGVAGDEGGEQSGQVRGHDIGILLCAVSQANVDLVKTIYARWTDGESARDLIAKDLAYVNPPYAVESGTRRDRRTLSRIRDVYPDFHVEPERFVDAGDDVVVVGMARGTAASGVEAQWKQGYVWTVRDGKAVVFRWFSDPAEAFAAVGLEP